MKKTASVFAALIGMMALTSLSLGWKKPGREYYELSIYYFNTPQQEKLLDNYLETALVPALHRLKIDKVGVFRNRANDTASVKSVYVLVPVKNSASLIALNDRLAKDGEYQAKGEAFLSTPYDKPAYTRMETILLYAFPLAPISQVPILKGPKADRVYELRSYESPSERIFRNKVKMFNDGDEIGLFRRLNFNAVFYSEVIAGAKRPNLMYMTSFENQADRDAHWKAFSDDPQWKQLSSLPEYQHNVSHIDITFLRPTEYSDF